MILKPMAMDGKDAVWSMGDDTPLAPLARSPRPIYAFFRQRFAQVTNPPTDSLREARVLQLHTRLGPWPHMLNKHAPLSGLSLSSPFLSLAQTDDLRARHHALAGKLPLAVLECVFSPSCNLARPPSTTYVRRPSTWCAAVLRCCCSPTAIATERPSPSPWRWPLAAVHHALTRAGVRTFAGLAVEAGDCRDLHHAAVLLGMGAGAVCPWLALETARSLNPEKGEANLLHALDLGLAKIMSKMGISVVDSYRGAHLFDCHRHSAAKSSTAASTVPGPARRHRLPRDRSQSASCGREQPASARPSPRKAAPRRTARHRRPHAKTCPTTAGSASARPIKLSRTAGSRRPSGCCRPLSAVPSRCRCRSRSRRRLAAFATQAIEKEPAVLRDLLEIRPAGAFPGRRRRTRAEHITRFHRQRYVSRIAHA